MFPIFSDYCIDLFPRQSIPIHDNNFIIKVETELNVKKWDRCAYDPPPKKKTVSCERSSRLKPYGQITDMAKNKNKQPQDRVNEAFHQPSILPMTRNQTHLNGSQKKAFTEISQSRLLYYKNLLVAPAHPSASGEEVTGAKKERWHIIANLDFSNIRYPKREKTHEIKQLSKKKHALCVKPLQSCKFTVIFVQ